MTTQNRSWLFISVLLIYSLGSIGQHSTDYGIEIQVYPTGVIPAIKIESNRKDKDSYFFRFGYNWIRHRDLGVHDDERGDGYGLTLGYRRYLKPGHLGWSLGLKSDLWMNELSWKDYDSGTSNLNTSGKTKIKVLQPTAELAYTMKYSSIIIVPTIALGYEWNVRTEGEPTGQGTILLLGVQMSKRFSNN